MQEGRGRKESSPEKPQRTGVASTEEDSKRGILAISQNEKHGQTALEKNTLYFALDSNIQHPTCQAVEPTKGLDLPPDSQTWGSSQTSPSAESSSATHALPPPIRLYFFHLVPIALTLG